MFSMFQCPGCKEYIDKDSFCATCSTRPSQSYASLNPPFSSRSTPAIMSASAAASPPSNRSLSLQQNQEEEDVLHPQPLNCGLTILLMLAILDGKISNGGVIERTSDSLRMTHDATTTTLAILSSATFYMLLHNALKDRHLPQGIWGIISSIFVITVLITEGALNYRNNQFLFTDLLPPYVEDAVSGFFALSSITLVGMVSHNILIKLGSILKEIGLTLQREATGDIRNIWSYLMKVLGAAGLASVCGYTHFYRVMGLTELSGGEHKWIPPETLKIVGAWFVAAAVTFDKFPDIMKSFTEYLNHRQSLRAPSSISSSLCVPGFKKVASSVISLGLLGANVAPISRMLFDKKGIGLSVVYAFAISISEGPIIADYVSKTPAALYETGAVA
jgi:hypothetical protein